MEPTRQKTVLLTEDEPLLANIFKQRLEKEGINVLLAKDGDEALKIIKSQSLDLIILDVILPKVSGFEILENLRQDSQFKRIPIIIVSNLGQDTDIAKSQSLGAVEYFVKAKISIEDLIGKIKGFLKV